MRLGFREQQNAKPKLIDADTMLRWAASMTWKGLHPVVQLSRQVYDKA